MTIEEKYGIVYESEKRYYVFDMTTKLPVLEDTVPYFFKYNDIEIYESSWNKMTIRILEEIDKKSPKSEEELLAIQYFWSKQEVFSKNKKTNHTPYRKLFLNTNHSSTHAMMSIQCLLKSYGVDLSNCFFLIRRHHAAEPLEVRQFFRAKTISDFSMALKMKGLSDDKVVTIIKNFDYINKYLNRASKGFTDFFLFDDFNVFMNYKGKTIEEVGKRFFKDEKNYKVIKRCLDYLEDFYRNKKFYIWLENNKINSHFLELIEQELNYLFDKLNTTIIVCNKLYGRIALLYKNELLQLGEMNSSSGLFKICSVFFSRKYYFQEPYISTKEINNITSEQVIVSYAYTLNEFTIEELNDYIDNMHLKKMDNYLNFIIEASEKYVQVDLDRLVAKDIFEMSDNDIESVEKGILFYIKSFGKLDSEKYNGYISLPKTKYQWNKFLLIGIIRSFLSEQFTIEYTANNYKKLSYIIDIKRQ